MQNCIFAQLPYVNRGKIYKHLISQKMKTSCNIFDNQVIINLLIKLLVLPLKCKDWLSLSYDNKTEFFAIVL